MIYYIYSDMPSFKRIQFRPGLNIVLAEKSPNATERQTRNGVGKSSLTELIHFLLASDKSSLFKAKVLEPYLFGMELDLGQARRQVERSVRGSNKVAIQGFETEDWPKDFINTNLFGIMELPIEQWKSVLGRFMFSLNDEAQDKFGPRFRSLFSYFVRRQSAGGFLLPTKHANHQQLWDLQVSISYLLGLDWKIPQQWQRIREREKSLKELRKAADEGTLGNIIGTTAELRTQLTLAEHRSNQLREHVNNFQLHSEYRNLEQEANQLTHEMRTLLDENTIDRLLLTDLEEALNREVNPSTSDLEHLYREAGVLLSNSIVHRFEEVKQFHESIITNRRSYLGSEVEAAKQRIRVREERMPGISDRLAAIMAILRSHGALDQLTKLQSELAKQDAKTEAIRQRFLAAEQLEGEKNELEFERNQLEKSLRRDYHEQGELLRNAILAFGNISSDLYEEAGNFTIDASPNGPLFDVTIRGEKSKGISNMQIFCFDMMLMQLCAERGIGPGFLVHDSHIFDGVDERQIAKALQIGEKAARDLNFQYIVTMNSDAIPKEFPIGFDINKYILPERLTDATEEGGLFGIRF